MAHGAVKHDYHLVNPSPWPVLASIALFAMAVGGVGYMKGLFGIPEGSLWSLAPGFVMLLYVLVGWWGDVIKEGREGDHTPVVSITLRYGMVLFIASEVMFFVAWFWAFFEMTIFHEARAGGTFDQELYEPLAAWAQWPPMQVDGQRVETFDPFHLPLINTLVLLLSGTTVTWAHHALQQDDRKGAIWGLVCTVALGIFFTGLQALEYSHAHFTYDGSLYGSGFFMATGFHGAHVVIGTIFLAVCLLRLIAGGMSANKHLGFEFAAWYWHFVDVVWLFLFAFVYVAPRLVLGA
ncbi:MAG: cytochrome c oxidase subunit 3 [Pseudomonadota bacterium]